MRLCVLITLSWMYLTTLCIETTYAGQGKLIGTAGLTQIEGSGGGGLVPWATISGYDSRDEISVTAFSTHVFLENFRLQNYGFSAGFFDRVEISAMRQKMDLIKFGGAIRQSVYGVKARISGDVIYSIWPQVSIGAQHKRLTDPETATALSAAKTDSGTDVYIAFTKVHMGAVYGYNTVWNLTARNSKANQLGLLGYGSSNGSSKEWLLELSAGILLTRNFAIGIEYRQKPDNLNLREDDWTDVFISYIPNKRFNTTLAWASLGSIAGLENQRGVYFSITGYPK